MAMDIQDGGGLDYFPEQNRDPWGRMPGDPWYGIDPNTPTGPVPYAPDKTAADDPYTPPKGEDPTQPPPPQPPSGGGGGGGTSGVPQFTAPALPTIAPFQSQLNPYEYSSFDASPYQVDPFKAPSLDEAKNEPGYEFARTEGIRALMNANLPMLRSGGTLKNLIGWGDRFAEQNYGNVYNRAANTYGVNRDTTAQNFGQAFQTHGANEAGKLGQFNTNYGVERDTFDRNAGLSLDLYDRDLRGKLAEFDPRFDGYLAMLESLTRLGTAGAGGA